MPTQESLPDRPLGAFEQIVLRHLMHLIAETVEVKSALAVLLALERERMVAAGETPDGAAARVRAMLDQSVAEHRAQLEEDLRRARERFEKEILFKELWEKHDDDTPPV